VRWQGRGEAFHHNDNHHYDDNHAAGHHADHDAAAGVLDAERHQSRRA